MAYWFIQTVKDLCQQIIQKLFAELLPSFRFVMDMIVYQTFPSCELFLLFTSCFDYIHLELYVFH